jgi:hypothetical protein
LRSGRHQELESVISSVKHNNDVSGGRSYLDIVDIGLLAMADGRAVYVTMKFNMPLG